MGVLMIIQEVDQFYAAYRKSDKGHYVEVNDDVLKAAGVSSASNIIGLTDKDLAWHEMAPYYAENEKRIYATQKTHIFYEPCLYAGRPQVYRATKAPIFGRSGKVIGINAVSLLISDRCLIRLTKQQTACLKHLALGFTHK